MATVVSEHGDGPIHGATYSYYSLAFFFSGELWIIFMAVGFFAPSGGIGHDACVGSESIPVSVQWLWRILLILTALLSPAATLAQPLLAALRFTGRGHYAFQLRQTFYQFPPKPQNHARHAKVYAICGVGQAVFVALGAIYSAALLSARCGALRMRAIMVMLSMLSLCPFIMYKCKPFITGAAKPQPRGCVWSAAYEAWSTKFAVDCAAAAQDKYATRVVPDMPKD